MALLSAIPEIFPKVADVLPAHTFVHQFALPIGLTLSIAWGALGLRKGYQADNLPSGITKAISKVAKISK